MSDDSLSGNLQDKALSHFNDLIPELQEAIQAETGKRLPESVIAKILEPHLEEVATEVSLIASHAYAGPMPSPHVMRGYADIYPNAPAQLFEQFKEE